jgi:hypothetical protein
MKLLFILLFENRDEIQALITVLNSKKQEEAL